MNTSTRLCGDNIAVGTSINFTICLTGTRKKTSITLKNITLTTLEIYQKETAFPAEMNYETIEKLVSTSVPKPTPLPRDPEEPTR